MGDARQTTRVVAAAADGNTSADHVRNLLQGLGLVTVAQRVVDGTVSDFGALYCLLVAFYFFYSFTYTVSSRFVISECAIYKFEVARRVAVSFRNQTRGQQRRGGDTDVRKPLSRAVSGLGGGCAWRRGGRCAVNRRVQTGRDVTPAICVFSVLGACRSGLF
ncbi:hypothetical protein BDZ88DRAFT_24042 [Geranomyces variabilis]|nr:hypothetical protein BDZ88DRAFT_24042 [Geranomyces variabilis]